MQGVNVEFRWENFRAFKDTGWIKIKPITIFIGPNASGKTSLLQPFLILGQTLKSADEALPLMATGEYVNAGTFKDIIHNHQSGENLRFSLKFINKKAKKRKTSKIGSLPSAHISLTFSQKGRAMPQLKRYIVEDGLGRGLLKRSLRKNGNYSLSFCKKFPKSTLKDSRLYNNILNQKPKQFIFQDRPIFKEEINLISKKGKALFMEIKFSPVVSLYLAVIHIIEMKLLRFLNAIKYIGPLRASPKRYYEFRGEHHPEVGPCGEFIHAVLFRMKGLRKERTMLNRWLKYFGLAREIDCKLRKANLIELLVKPIERNITISIADTGFGVSQLLPLIVQSIIAQKNDIIITEQPEIHLNPKLESRLADFFVSMVRNEKHFIIETHSEHFVLRLRTLIKKGNISPSDVAIYFTESVGKENKVRKIEVDKNGEFPKDDWPRGFFEEALTESLRFATLKRK